MFSMSSQHWPDGKWSDWTDSFMRMPECEFDYWVDEFPPSDVHYQSFDTPADDKWVHFRNSALLPFP
jgi:hypothetical protein